MPRLLKSSEKRIAQKNAKTTEVKFEPLASSVKEVSKKVLVWSITHIFLKVFNHLTFDLRKTTNNISDLWF